MVGGVAPADHLATGLARIGAEAGIGRGVLTHEEGGRARTRPPRRCAFLPLFSIPSRGGWAAFPRAPEPVLISQPRLLDVPDGQPDASPMLVGRIAPMATAISRVRASEMASEPRQIRSRRGRPYSALPAPSPFRAGSFSCVPRQRRPQEPVQIVPLAKGQATWPFRTSEHFENLAQWIAGGPRRRCSPRC